MVWGFCDRDSMSSCLGSHASFCLQNTECIKMFSQKYVSIGQSSNMPFTRHAKLSVTIHARISIFFFGSFFFGRFFFGLFRLVLSTALYAIICDSPIFPPSNVALVELVDLFLASGTVLFLCPLLFCCGFSFWVYIHRSFRIWWPSRIWWAFRHCWSKLQTNSKVTCWKTTAIRLSYKAAHAHASVKHASCISQAQAHMTAI